MPWSAKPVGLFDAQGDFRAPENQSERPTRQQLRQEDKAGQLWNMVGFQTNLRWGEQKRVFQLIPGLTDAEFVRLGVMHRNTFINAPQFCNRHCKAPPDCASSWAVDWY